MCGVLFLCSPLLPVSLCCKLPLPWPSWTLSSVLNSVHWAPPCAVEAHSLKTLNWSNCGAYLVCFLSLRDHYPLLFDVQCLTSHHFIYIYVFLFFGCCRWEGKSGPCSRSGSPHLYFSFYPSYSQACYTLLFGVL